jgi:hypothetical protein
MKHFTDACNKLSDFFTDTYVNEHSVENLVQIERDLANYVRITQSKIRRKKLLDLNPCNEFISQINNIFIDEKNDNGKITYSCNIILDVLGISVTMIIVYNSEFGPSSAIYNFMKISKIHSKVIIDPNLKQTFIEFENIIKKHVWIHHDNFDYYNELF